LLVENIIFDGNSTGTNVAVYMANSGNVAGWIRFCKAQHMGSNIGFQAGGPSVFATFCETFEGQFVNLSTINCVASGNCGSSGGGAFTCNINGGVYLNCVAYNLSGGCSGFRNGGGGDGSLYQNCLAYGGVGDGFIYAYNGSGGTGQCTYLNCLSVNNGGLGFNASGNCEPNLYNCAAYNNTVGNLSGNISAANIFNFLNLTAAPFNNPSGLDFSLNNDAGGGALLRAAGVPEATGLFALPSLSTPGYEDIGLVQHKDLPGLSRARLVNAGG
jgi:hypothetical protein